MGEKKNIAVTINSLGPGGSEKQSLLLAKALKSDHNTLLIILSANGVYPSRLRFVEEAGLEHVFLSNNPLRRMVQLYRILRRKKIEISFSFLPADTVLVAICGKLAGVSHIFGGLRNSYHPWLKFAVLRAVNNHILKHTIANNYAAYHSAIKFGFKKKVFVIHNGIEVNPLRKEEISNKKTISIISVGRLVAQKNYETAMQSISLLKEKLNEEFVIDYKIVGQGPQQDAIMAQIKKYQLQSVVELITDPGDIYPILSSSHIYLCTSNFEGLSNAIMEAMNCALPIVATDVGDNARLVIHGKNGFITNPQDPADIAERLHHLIVNPNVRHEMGVNSYRHIAENFSFNRFKNDYLNIIKDPGDIEIRGGEIIKSKLQP